MSDLVQDVELFINECDSMKFAKYTIRFDFITIACKFGDLSEEKKQEIFSTPIKFNKFYDECLPKWCLPIRLWYMR